MNDSLDYLVGSGASLFKLYTQICLCFPRTESSRDAAIIDGLTKGLERLTANFPWAAGQVVSNDQECRPLDAFKIRPMDEIPRLIVKDHQGEATVPSMGAMREAGFPSHMLDESIIAPCTTLPSSTDLSGTAPIFLVQVNFIKGGLLLTLNTQHNVLDMVGQGALCKFLCKACHNEPFTDDEIAAGNADRRKIIDLLSDSFKPGPELAHQISETTSKPPESNEPPLLSLMFTRTYFIFSPASLAELKTHASKTLDPSAAYISTDDAVSALIYQCIMRARLPRLGGGANIKLMRAIDARTATGVSPHYMGNLMNQTYLNYELQELVDAPLGSIASRLRAELDPKHLAYRTRALATHLSRVEDPEMVSVTATIDASRDMMLSSWAKVDYYDMDFNFGLGKPEAVRRPQFTAVEGLGYLMPRRPDGEIAFGICLRDEDMTRLRSDQDFVKYCRYVG